ncbi:ABC1 kinase family protein [Mycolicibacterium fortuitum]|uniref:ABC1 kinase family protein n=1 Tax=Mycolicibacterium fortuitum TaxID=1766 RepID=UPI0009BF36C5|nr:AarF/ABC1/UbiB kinase family protein [Mycolicibacterium fortuitum]
MTSSDNVVPRGRVRRTMPLAGFTARAAGGRLVAGLRERAGDSGAVERFHERTAERYTELLGHSKGALMKAGQILSMVDAEAIGNIGFAPYQKALARLQTAAPPMPADLVRAVLRDELGSGIECFAEFEDAPIAAASVGQVHRAVLCDGRVVAVKIQYPGVAQAIRDDLANTELLITFMRLGAAATGMTIDIRAMADEISARITEEVDYRHEAAMITAFADLLRGHPFIRVPEVVPEASTGRVLTMTYLEGMDWAAAQQADQDLRNTWAEVIFRFINTGSRHGNISQVDPHPGNFRFNPDGTVGCLDFGCVQTFPERARWLFLASMHAGMEGRYQDCRDHMTEMGLISAEKPLEEQDLRRIISDMTHATSAPQPVTYTSDAAAGSLRALFGDQNFLPAGQMTVTREFVFLPRLQIAFDHIATGLRATVPVRSILEDLSGIAEPTTELGKLHHAWVRERGLPCGLDHHDQP